MFSGLGPPEIIFLIVIVVLLFGAKRLPDAARSLGRSLRIFKSEVKEMSHDDDTQPSTVTAPKAVNPPQPGQQVPGQQQASGDTYPSH